MGLAIKKEESVECGKGWRGCLARHFIAAARMLQLLPGPGRVGDEILVSVISKCHKMDKIAIDTFNSVEMMLKLFHTLWVKLEQG